MKRDVRPLATTVTPEALADLYCRLYDKSARPECLFDPSWEIEPVAASARQAWSAKVLHFASGVNAREPFFSHFIERLILLAPRELQKLLCAAVLLSKSAGVRRCIDGAVVRRLDSVIGTAGLAAIRSMHANPAVQPTYVMTDWSVRALLGEAYAHIDLIYRGQRQLVLEYLRVALPRELPHVRSDCGEADFERLVRQAHELYPEFKWLFG